MTASCPEAWSKPLVKASRFIYLLDLSLPQFHFNTICILSTACDLMVFAGFFFFFSKIKIGTDVL